MAEYNLGLVKMDQIVLLDKKELRMLVLGVQTIDNPDKYGLPEDALCIGYIVKFDTEHTLGQYVPLYFSATLGKWTLAIRFWTIEIDSPLKGCKLIRGEEKDDFVHCRVAGSTINAWIDKDLLIPYIVPDREYRGPA